MNNAKRWFKKHYKDILIDIGIGIFVVGLLIAGGLFLWVSSLDIPDLSAFEERRILQSTKIYDRTGEILLYDLHEDVRRTIIPYEDISRHIKNATVAIEDDTFFEHMGVRPLAIMRAAWINLQGGDLLGGQGGSTITQQVVKNSILQREKTLTRKAKEAILSLRLEQELTKEEILGHYLNESPYGGTIYGAEQASRSFFGKSASDVTLGEAAYLAALPQSPTRYSPYGNNKDLLDARQKLVLERMKINNFITEEEYQTGINEEVVFQPQAVTGIRAPHFVFYVREQLVDRYGEEAISERGFKVITTLDYELQAAAEEIVKEKALSNTQAFSASNAGLVAIDPQTGDILTMVGSRDYFDEEIDGNFNVALAPRQPGSSIKPIVYASAFAEGYTPDTVVYDLKTQFGANCDPWDPTSESPCYSPNNYNGQFKGPINLRNALAQSLNIPAVKVLYLTGLRDAIKLAGDMGISTLDDPDRLGLTLVLGGGEVKLLEHTGAYGVLANEGVRANRRSILRIENSAGEVIEEVEVEEERVLDRDVALMMSDVLSDNVARTPLWGSNSLVQFTERDVAAKSGSTNDLRDAWIMGYTPNLAVGAWVGNNDNSRMGGGLSGLITTPMWRAFMDVALEKIEPQEFASAPATDPSLKPILRGHVVDAGALIANMQASDSLNIASVANSMHNILHYVVKSDPQGPYPTNPAADSQYQNWEYAVGKYRDDRFGALIQQAAEQAAAEEEDDTEDDDEEANDRDGDDEEDRDRRRDRNDDEEDEEE
ncbi:transglycosylase domain-containing protein [Candidatus Pacebacteria bacterium]|nr:transglycosylase domain-containing protein [Candidatus Paceibacterota bacterium]